MTMVNQDFQMWAGDSKNLPVANTDEDGGVVNLGSCTVRWVLRRGPRGGPTLISKHSGAGGGITITDAPGGIFQISLDPADTLALAGVYYHEASMVDGSGNVSTLLTGQASIERSAVAEPT